MQLKDVQKKCSTAGGILLAVIVLLVGCGYGLTVLSEDYTAEITEVERKTNETAMTANRLREQFIKVQQNSDLYKEALDKIIRKQLSIEETQIARAKFEELKIRYFLTNVRLTVQPPQDIPGHRYKTLKDVMMSREVSITVDALTDEDVYSFVHAMHTELPGVVKITGFDIERKGRPTDVGLREIVDSGQPPLVAATVKFNWYGLKDLGLVTAALDRMGKDYAYAQ